MKFLKSILSVLLVLVCVQLFAQEESEFSINSSGIKPDGSLIIDFTGEAEGVSLPLEWTNVPEGTKSFALSLWHLPHATDPSDVKSYWVVYNIPSDIKSIPRDASDFGTVGYNDKDFMGYDPMKSKGPGVKEYNVTIYALSGDLEFNDVKVCRADLLKAIEGKVLGESTLKFTYETGKSVHQSRGSEDGSKSLTEEQKETVKSILSNYDADTLSAKDAKGIHEAFREAGLRGGPAIEEVIRHAGFNPEKLRDLAPPSHQE